MGKRAAAGYRERTGAVAPASAAASAPSDIGDLAHVTAANDLSAQALEALRAGAGAEDAPPPAAERPKRIVRVGTRDVELEAEVADALEERDRRTAHLEGQLESVRREPAPAAPAAPPEARQAPERPQRPSIKLAVDDPEAYDRAMGQYERELDAYEQYRALDLEQRLETRYRSDQSQQTAAARQRAEMDDFVGRLKRAHPLLDGEDRVIIGAMQDVAAAHPGRELRLAATETFELVSRAAMGEITRLAQKGRGTAPKPPRLEGQAATRVGAAGERREPSPKHTTIADIQRARRLQRRTATTRGRE